jgi:hypothetical protein
VALEAAERFLARLSLGSFAFEVGGGVGVPVGFVDREAVQRAVELSIAAAVQAVAGGVARGGDNRRCAAGARQLSVGGESVGAGDLTDQPRRGQRAAPALCE